MSAAIPKVGFRPDEAANFLGSPKLLEEMVAARWLTPVVKRNKMTLYDGGALAKCWARILGGEMPPRLSSKTK